MDEQLKESGVEHPMHHSVAHSPEAELLGRNLEDIPDLVKEANPERYISSDTPPFLIQHGLEDNLVPFAGFVRFARKLGKVLGYNRVALFLTSRLHLTRHSVSAFPSQPGGGVTLSTRASVGAMSRGVTSDVNDPFLKSLPKNNSGTSQSYEYGDP